MKGYYGAYEGFDKILFDYKRPPMGVGWIHEKKNWGSQKQGEFGIRTRALNTAFFDNPQCGFYFVGSILKRSWVPNCHLKLRWKAIDILPLGARLKKYGHLNHPHISTTNHLGHDNSRP